MENLHQYGEFGTWMQMLELTPLAIVLWLFLAFVGTVVFGPHLRGRG